MPGVTTTPVSPGDLYELCDELLTFAAGALDSLADWPETADLDGAPDARFITAGLPAIDCCPGLWAYVGPLSEGPTSPARTGLDPGHRSGSFPRISLPTINLLIVRCTPTFTAAAGGADVEFPSSAELAGVARQVYADGWVLWTSISRAIRAGDLLTRCSEAFLDSGLPVDPSGGCVGWTMTMRVNLPSYPAAV